jgi:DcuC family C4-dicarboxylate transporter
MLLIPGVVLVGTIVNVPIISQSSTAVAVGSVLVPILNAARISPTTIGAALALGSSIGGELLNPGAPELRSVSNVCGVSAINCVEAIWPLLLVHLSVTVPLFWFLCRHGEQQTDMKMKEETFRVNPFKAIVPLIPLILLFVTALPKPFRLLTVPNEWLVAEGTRADVFDSRLIGAAMLIGVLVAALTSPEKAPKTAKVFFEGAGYALANITSLIVAAGCFAKGVEVVKLAGLLENALSAVPALLMPLAGVIPLGFAWGSGSGMATTEGLFRFYYEPAAAHDVNPVRVGAVVSLAAAAGRTLSPVSAVVLMSASLSGATPLAMVKRMAWPLLAGVTAVVIVAMVMG